MLRSKINFHNLCEKLIYADGLYILMNNTQLILLFTRIYCAKIISTINNCFYFPCKHSNTSINVNPLLIHFLKIPLNLKIFY